MSRLAVEDCDRRSTGRKLSLTFSYLRSTNEQVEQGLSQDLETGCLKLAVVKFWGVQIFKGHHNILIFQPYICINSVKKRHDIIKQCHGNYKEMK